MTTKRCPFCAEEIQAAAIKCKHCGSMVAEQKSAATSPSLTYSKRLGAWGWPCLIAGILLVLSALGSLGKNLIGPAILSGALGAGLIWFAWNNGAVSFACPQCGNKIATTLKARELSCAKCQHRIALKPL